MPSRSHTTTTTTATHPVGPAAPTMAASRLAQHNSPTPLPASVASTNGALARRSDIQTTGSSSSPSRRPSSAPSSKNNVAAALTNGDGFVGNHTPVTVASRSSAAADAASLSDRRPSSAKPKLLRSKSDFVLHSEDGYDSDPDDSDADHHRRQSNNAKGKKISSWGARHGFGDHYDSEEISHLVNVRLPFILSDSRPCFYPGWCDFIITPTIFIRLRFSLRLPSASCSLSEYTLSSHQVMRYVGSCIESRYFLLLCKTKHVTLVFVLRAQLLPAPGASNEGHFLRFFASYAHGKPKQPRDRTRGASF